MSAEGSSLEHQHSQHGLVEVAPPQQHQFGMPQQQQPHVQHHGAPQPQQIKIRVHNLYFPATFDIDELRSAMQFAQQTHVWFERQHGHNRQLEPKQGGVSMHFDTEEDAKRSFELIQLMTKKCYGLKIQAPRHFYEQPQPPAHCPVDENEPEMQLKLVVYQLLPSAEKPCLEALFDQDEMLSIEIMNDTRKTDGSKLAIVKFREESQMQSAVTELDGFTIDDGNVSRPIRCLPYEDFVRKSKPGGEQSPHKQHKTEPAPVMPTGSGSPSDALMSSLVHLEQTVAARKDEPTVPPPTVDAMDTSATSNDQQPEASTQALSGEGAGDQQTAEQHEAPPEETEQPKAEPQQHSTPSAAFTDEDIAEAIDELIERERINWAELSTVEELWDILDRVSTALGGVVDKELKSGMMHVLHSHLQQSQAPWMHRHLNELIRTWKKELRDGKPRRPPSPKPVAAAPHYSPPREQAKPKKAKSQEQKRQVTALMGIGAMLAAAKEKYQPEEGEVKEERAAESSPVHGPESDPAGRRKRPHTPSDDGQQQRRSKRPKRASRSKVGRQREQIRKLKQKLAALKKQGGVYTGDDTNDTSTQAAQENGQDLEEGEMASSDEEATDDRKPGSGERAAAGQEPSGTAAEHPATAAAAAANKIVPTAGSHGSWSASSSSSSSSSDDDEDDDESDDDDDNDDEARSTGSDSDFSSSVGESENELELQKMKARERRRLRRERQRKRKHAAPSGMSALMRSLMDTLSHMYKCRVELFKQMPMPQRQQLRTVFAQVRMHQSAIGQAGYQQHPQQQQPAAAAQHLYQHNYQYIPQPNR